MPTAFHLRSSTLVTLGKNLGTVGKNVSQTLFLPQGRNLMIGTGAGLMQSGTRNWSILLAIRITPCPSQSISKNLLLTRERKAWCNRQKCVVYLILPQAIKRRARPWGRSCQTATVRFLMFDARGNPQRPPELHSLGSLPVRSTASKRARTWVHRVLDN